ncbi:MAG: hypothetical protein CAF45_005095 [Nitrospira sp. CG24E]|nr:MAG: hypothetical protein CAF45_005095 [Nitrospira sp. CG24E]
MTITAPITPSKAFQRFTTPAVVSEMLRSYLPEFSNRSWEIRECAIGDTKLKTYLRPESKVKSTLSVCYQVTLREAATGESSRRILYAKMFLGGRSKEAFQRLTDGGWTDSELQQAITHVPDLDMILWRFPHDPGLPHLRHLMNLHAVREHLPAEGLRNLGMSGTPQVLASHVVNYRPEIRCTNRYDLYDPHHDRASQLFGKTFRAGEGQALSERLEYFWNRSLADPNAMAVAQPLGYAAPVNTVWQLGVPGMPLLQTLDRSNYEQYLASVSKGLASLHTSNVADLATHAPADHIVEVRKKLLKLSDAIPRLAIDFEAMADRLEQTAPHPSDIPFRPIHWDFHVHQLLACKGKLVFCDLDELVIGDPVQDLANFMVDLHFRNLDREFVRLMEGELYRSYRKQAEWNVPLERLAWHSRLQFVNKAYRSYLQFAPDFEQTVEQIFRLAAGDSLYVA